MAFGGGEGHRKAVCSLYRQAMRLSFDWNLNKADHRSFILATRRQFDRHAGEAPGSPACALVMDAARYLLWKFRHPEPYKYPTAPGGVAYDRELVLPREICERKFDPNICETH